MVNHKKSERLYFLGSKITADGECIYKKYKEENTMDFETVKNMIAEQLKVDPAEIKPESRLMDIVPRENFPPTIV